MSFSAEVKQSVLDYMGAHLPENEWYSNYFSFVEDSVLANRLAEEFRAAREIYKMFRGLDADGWLQRAQVRIQVLQYASIYEAVIHHLLFERLSTHLAVHRLVEFPKLVRFDIPQDKLAVLQRHLVHDLKTIIPTYQGTGRQDQTKVRFDDKVECAVELQLLEPWLAEDLVKIYEARNAVHIHAELRKNLQYEVDLARMSYRRMQPFRAQIIEGMSRLSILPEHTHASELQFEE